MQQRPSHFGSPAGAHILRKGTPQGEKHEFPSHTSCAELEPPCTSLPRKVRLLVCHQSRRRAEIHLHHDLVLANSTTGKKILRSAAEAPWQPRCRASVPHRPPALSASAQCLASKSGEPGPLSRDSQGTQRGEGRAPSDHRRPRRDTSTFPPTESAKRAQHDDGRTLFGRKRGALRTGDYRKSAAVLSPTDPDYPSGFTADGQRVDFMLRQHGGVLRRPAYREQLVPTAGVQGTTTRPRCGWKSRERADIHNVGRQSLARSYTPGVVDVAAEEAKVRVLAASAQRSEPSEVQSKAGASHISQRSFQGLQIADIDAMPSLAHTPTTSLPSSTRSPSTSATWDSLPTGGSRETMAWDAPAVQPDLAPPSLNQYMLSREDHLRTLKGPVGGPQAAVAGRVSGFLSAASYMKHPGTASREAEPTVVPSTQPDVRDGAVPVPWDILGRIQEDRASSQQLVATATHREVESCPGIRPGRRPAATILKMTDPFAQAVPAAGRPSSPSTAHFSHMQARVPFSNEPTAMFVRAGQQLVGETASTPSAQPL